MTYSGQPFASPGAALAQRLKDDGPETYLEHYGVKGMKWGVRKEDPPPGELILSQECKNGTQLNVYKDKRFSDDVDVRADLYHAFEFRDRSGAKVGTASFYKERPESTSLELEWIGVDKDHRSNGYARAALTGVMEYSKQNGITDLEMSATKMGQPLYESLGFTRVPGSDRKLLGIFKTLPRYRLHIPAEVAHSGSVKSLLDYIVKAVDNDPELTPVEHSGAVEDFLEHYGVKGMKWGVRKGEETGTTRTFPKDQKKINTAKAEKLEAHAERFQKEIDRVNALPPARLKFVQNGREKNVQEYEKVRDQFLKDAKQVREGRLTDGQKTALKGLVIVGGAVALYSTYKYVDSGQALQTRINAQERLTGKKHEWKKKDSLSRVSDPANIQRQVVDQINSDFGAYGTKMNCRRCTFAYEMRRRGYDVKATKSNAATGQNFVGVKNATDPNSKRGTSVISLVRQQAREKKQGGGFVTDTLKNGSIWGEKRIGDGIAFVDLPADLKSRQIFSALSREPNGSRGEIGVGWKMGGGHSMAYEVFNGRATIFDAQSGARYSDPSSFDKFAEVVTAAAHTRLDNKSLNDEYLKRWVQNVD